MLVFILVVAIVIALGIAGAFLEAKKPSKAEPRYRARGTLLTQAEQRFQSALRADLPRGLAICPKVRLCDVIQPESGPGYTAAFNRISSKHLDFVLVHPVSSKIIAAIELDDSSHQREKQQKRDALVESAMAMAGVPLLRVKAATRYDIAAILAPVEFPSPEPDLIPKAPLGPPASAGSGS